MILTSVFFLAYQLPTSGFNWNLFFVTFYTGYIHTCDTHTHTEREKTYARAFYTIE